MSCSMQNSCCKKNFSRFVACFCYDVDAIESFPIFYTNNLSNVFHKLKRINWKKKMSRFFPEHALQSEPDLQVCGPGVTVKHAYRVCAQGIRLSEEITKRFNGRNLWGVSSKICIAIASGVVFAKGPKTISSGMHIEISGAVIGRFSWLWHLSITSSLRRLLEEFLAIYQIIFEFILKPFSGEASWSIGTSIVLFIANILQEIAVEIFAEKQNIFLIE